MTRSPQARQLLVNQSLKLVNAGKPLVARNRQIFAAKPGSTVPFRISAGLHGNGNFAFTELESGLVKHAIELDVQAITGVTAVAHASGE